MVAAVVDVAVAWPGGPLTTLEVPPATPLVGTDWPAGGVAGTAPITGAPPDVAGANSSASGASVVKGEAGTAEGLTDPFTPLTSEALVSAAPDAILMTTTGLESVGGVAGLLEIPGIAQTPAGRQQRIITVEDGLLFSFGTRTPEALAQIIEQLHP